VFEALTCKRRRRTFGSIWPAMLVHASQDFVILTGQVGVDPNWHPRPLW
jgi:hypothetical protein